MFENMVVTLQRDDPAQGSVVRHAAAVAERFNSRVFLLTVVPERQAMQSESNAPAIPRGSKEAVHSQRADEIDAAERFLESARERFGRSLSVETIVRPGDLQDAVEKAIEEHDATLVVVPREQRESLVSRLFGTTTEDVVASANVAVLVAPDGDEA